MNVEMCPIK